jgi:hypothetical protein
MEGVAAPWLHQSSKNQKFRQMPRLPFCHAGAEAMDVADFEYDLTYIP